MSTAWGEFGVVTAGEGSGVLWLHGYTMDSDVWRPVWEHLPGWRHLGLDLPWHGRSPRLRPGEDRGSLADTVCRAALAAGVRHVVALSFGTIVAVEMAIRHPSAFASWTLAAPALVGGPHDAAAARRYVELAGLYRRRGPGPHMTALWMSCPPDIFAGVAARPRVRDALSRIIDRHPWNELRDIGMARLTAGVQRAGDLAAVAAPILVLIGDGEIAAHRSCAESIVAAAPRATLHVLAGSGHLAPLEEPGTAAAVIGGHLQAAESSGGRLNR